MKRPIKFRGRTHDGKTVFGYYVPQCPVSSYPGIVDDMDYIHEVVHDSIVQLVGYDKYFCLDADGKEFKSVFVPDFFKDSVLKETDHEKEIPAPVED